MAKLVAVLSTTCLICLLALIIVYQRLFSGGAAPRLLNSPAIVKEVRQLNELVTVRYSVEKVVGMKEEKSPVGMESILLLVQGKVLAGVNLSELRASDVTVFDGNAVRVRLMPPAIQEAFLDEKHTKIWDRSITWWTPWVTPDADLEHKARLQAVDDIKQAALEMGILPDAKRNAEADIRALLRAFGIEKVEFYYSS